MAITYLNVPKSYRRKTKSDGRLPAARGRVYRFDPPLYPLLGGDFGRYAPKKAHQVIIEYLILFLLPNRLSEDSAIGMRIRYVPRTRARIQM